MFWKLIAKLAAQPKIAAWLIERAQRTPYYHLKTPDGRPYMDRWWLFNPIGTQRRWDWLPISVRVHHIRAPDGDRHMHDHPWDARSIILRGWYVERRLLGDLPFLYFRDKSTTAPLSFGEFHHITSVSPEGVWTLCILYRYRGSWGFLVDGAKVHWRTYLARYKK